MSGNTDSSVSRFRNATRTTQELLQSHQLPSLCLPHFSRRERRPFFNFRRFCILAQTGFRKFFRRALLRRPRAYVTSLDKVIQRPLASRRCLNAGCIPVPNFCSGRGRIPGPWAFTERTTFQRAPPVGQRHRWKARGAVTVLPHWPEEAHRSCSTGTRDLVAPGRVPVPWFPRSSRRVCLPPERNFPRTRTDCRTTGKIARGVLAALRVLSVRSYSSIHIIPPVRHPDIRFPEHIN